MMTQFSVYNFGQCYGRSVIWCNIGRMTINMTQNDSGCCETSGMRYCTHAPLNSWECNWCRGWCLCVSAGSSMGVEISYWWVSLFIGFNIVLLLDWMICFFIVLGGLPYLLCINSCGDLCHWTYAVLAAYGMVLIFFFKDYIKCFLITYFFSVKNSTTFKWVLFNSNGRKNSKGIASLKIIKYRGDSIIYVDFTHM